MPYAGYFRLFASADQVILFDCVQFPRRGWVHRNMLPDSNAKAQWLTLPLLKAELGVKISELNFGEDAGIKIAERTSRFPSLAFVPCELQSLMYNPVGSVVDYLENTLAMSCSLLNLPFNVTRSSILKLPEKLTGMQRVIAAVNSLGGDTYLNPSGGRKLYDERTFRKQGLKLKFLNDWHGSRRSILHRFGSEDPAIIAKDIRTQSYLPSRE